MKALLALGGMLSLAACTACESSPGSSFRYASACQVGQDQRAIKLAQVFSDVELEAPIDLTHFRDGTGRIALAERAGRIRVIHPDGSVTTALDISDRVYPRGECGFLGIATHPRHAENRKLYADYCIERDKQTISVVSEWRMRADDPDVVDPASERVLLEVEQPYDNHNGGSLAFSNDGFLFIGFGDGGGGDDPLNAGQDTNTLLGKILRIDVDAGGAGARPYGIPADNPFADGGAGRPEIFAFGLRNPWRISVDRVTGKLWVGDVGQDAIEEVNIVELGKNYGWKIMEGTRCRPGGPDDCDKDGLALPAVQYDREFGRSITGGYVYRGARVPGLVGRYVYADYATRVVFSWKEGEPAPRKPMFVADGSIAAFGEDEAGELYALDIEGGRIFRFDEGLGITPEPPPARLSATGCFTDLAALAPAEGVLPYDIALPFWSDGAAKRRFVVMPPDGRADPRGSGAYRFPTGTVFIKHFEDLGVGGRRLETRFLVQEPLGVRGFTYRWDDDGDATLMDEAARLPVAHGEWHLPSPTDCTTCHRGLGVLGLEGRQLGPMARELRELGLLSAPPPPVEVLPSPSDAGVGLESRARAWLHVNCAYCHDGLGPSGTALDLRVGTLLKDAAACDAAPVRGDLGIADARVIAPGAPERSVLWHRIGMRDVHGMPPLATAIVDPQADVVREWIASLAGCPE